MAARRPRGITPKNVGRVYKIGEWDRAVRAARRLKVVAPAVLSTEMLNWARGTRDDLVNNLKQQKFDHAELHPETKRRKKAAGHDPDKKLIATGDYVNAIKVLPMGPYMWQVGITKNATNRRGVSLTTVGMVNEFGSARQNIPARPHWRPTYERAAIEGVVRFKAALHRILSTATGRISVGGSGVRK